MSAADPHISCLERAAADPAASPEVAARIRLIIAARAGVPASTEEEETHV